MSSLDETLSTIEAQLQDMQAALLSSAPQSLEQTAAQLRQAASTLAQALGQTVPQGAAERVQAIAQQLSLLRNQLARVLALTERQAASLLPPVQGVTYGPSAGTQGARIYRAPG
ncbi:MAG: hypothetical protein KGM60_05450 [Comamonadaceae bacterium]|nr:hypothetical protein [Pseudomonadota bacterium]MDE2414187.1 hypothetical protein [Comamonadaceae bacterium]